MMRYILYALVLTGLIFPFNMRGQSTRLHLVKKYAVSGNGGWDYITVDPDRRKIYIAHDTRVNILDEDTGSPVGEIANTSGVHGVALVDSLNKGFISNGRNNNVLVFDLKSNKILATIKAGRNPDAILYDEYSKKVLVFNGASHNATIIDPERNMAVATLALSGKPEAGVSNGKGTVFVNIENTGEVAVINTRTFNVEDRFQLHGGTDPTGIALDSNTGKLFIGCSNQKLLVLDSKTGKQLVALPIGRHCDGVAFDAGLNLIYASAGDGTLTVIKELSPEKFAVLESVKTEAGARTLALDKKTHRIFLPTAVLNNRIAGGSAIIPDSFHVLEVSVNQTYPTKQ